MHALKGIRWLGFAREHMQVPAFDNGNGSGVVKRGYSGPIDRHNPVSCMHVCGLCAATRNDVSNKVQLHVA